jgi:P4 family phage/plasmid primase-like protien
MSKTTATQLFQAGYTELVSVIPPGARLSAASKINPKELGKAPGKYYQGGLWGGYNWREFRPALGHAKVWEEQGANIGLHAAQFPAVDIDCTEPALAAEIKRVALAALGPAPERVGRAPKSLLVYGTSRPFTRMRLWITDDLSGEQHLIEVLGDGQQYVVAGTHPSGSAYEWSGPALHEVDPFDLNLLTPEKVELFFNEVTAAVEFMGYSTSREGAGKLSVDRDAIDQDNLRAPSMEECEAAVACLPNNNDLFPGRDDYLRVGYAIKAAAGEAGLPLFLDWAARWEGNDRVSGNDPEEAEADWHRMVPPYEVGWDYLAGLARGHGYDDAAADFGTEGLLPPQPAQENAPAADLGPAAAPTEPEEKSGPAVYSDTALAWRLINKFGGNLRYCDPLGGWQVYDKGVWRPDETRMAEHLAGKICLEQANKAMTDPSLDKGRKAQVMKLCSAGARMGALVAARSDRRITVRQDEFDADPWLLNTPAGVLDLRTGALGPHNAKQYHTRITAVAPEDGEPVEFLRFLREATNGDQGLMDLIQAKAGYWLTGITREHDITFIWGPGGNGKSVLVNVLSHILGDYAVVADTTTFSQTKQEQHPEAIASLRGARLVLANETNEGQAWNEARVKQASGGDKMRARFMNQNGFMFTPIFKLVFVGNHKPRIANLDQAIKRRFHLLPFTVTPKVIDRQLDEKLKAEAGKILAWAIEGCLRWQRDGVQLPEVVRNATAEYFTDEDPVGRFLEERCVVRHDATVYGASLYEAWREWAHEQGEHIRTARWLTSALSQRPGIERWKCSKTAQRGLRGVELIYTPGEFEAQPIPAATTA